MGKYQKVFDSPPFDLGFFLSLFDGRLVRRMSRKAHAEKRMHERMRKSRVVLSLCGPRKGET